ncbi:MAG: lipopolysaccharide biosynthesis protein [Bacteroidales bacterium]|jgi:O-antigen/teichoic acid export membrane protein|nr:lipopolysaccharide biosynthesis protein [Bacteroidales bacterium]
MGKPDGVIASGGLKEKAITGLLWSFGDNGFGQLIHFVVGIILARILSPQEFGLIGMITLFIALSQSFIDSGFQQALIRKSDACDTDFSTVFFFNLAVGVLFYGLIFIFSGAISSFYDEPQLREIIRVFGLVLVVNALALIQRVRLTRAINFRLLTTISLTCSLVSGAIAIWMAISGYGVWSLVWRTLLNQFMQAIALWYFNSWRPLAVFRMSSFRDMFSFGSRLLVSGLIDTLYKNIYYLIIGKYFSASDLGYYTRADHFQRLPSSNLTAVVQRVSYPVLASVKDDEVRLREGYRRIIRSTMFISFTTMIVLAAIAESLILVLIGDKWMPAAGMLQMLCFAGMLYPLHAMNLNMLNVKGRSDLFLRLEIIKKVLAVPVIIVGVIMGIRAMLAGMIINSFIAYFLNSYYSGRLVGYPVAMQVRDVLPSFIIAMLAGALTFTLSLLMGVNPAVMLSLQLLLATVVVLVLSELTRHKGYMEIRMLLLGRLFRSRKNK